MAVWCVRRREREYTRRIYASTTRRRLRRPRRGVGGGELDQLDTVYKWRVTEALLGGGGEGKTSVREEIEEIAKLQAEAFYAPLPTLPRFFDAGFLKLFEADVRGTLRTKMAVAPSGASFACLVIRRDDEIVGVAEVSSQRERDVAEAMQDHVDASWRDCDAESRGTGGAKGGGANARVYAGEDEVEEEGKGEGETSSQSTARYADDGYAYLACMAVREDCRGKRAASSLIHAAECVARRWGYDALALHVYASNEPAKRLYSRSGYATIDVDSWWRADLQHGPRELRMKRL